MATHVLTDAKVWVGDYNLSGDLNGVGLEYRAELLDDTVFGDTTRSRTGGLKMVTLNVQGIWNGADNEQDEELFGNIGTANVPVSVASQGGDVGEIAYLFRAIEARYAPGASIGELLRFEADAEGSDGAGLVQGYVLENDTLTATANGTAVQAGAAAAGQTIYAALHVLSASAADTLDVKIQSDSASNFPSATDRITFTQATARTSEWKTLAGAVTDTWWRIVATIGGTSPSFTFVVTLGIK